MFYDQLLRWILLIYTVLLHHLVFDLGFPAKEPALTTAASRRRPFFLTAALSAGGRAWGDLFWDDGDSPDTFETGSYSYVVFAAEQVSEETRDACSERNVETVSECLCIHSVAGG